MIKISNEGLSEVIIKVNNAWLIETVINVSNAWLMKAVNGSDDQRYQCRVN